MHAFVRVNGQRSGCVPEPQLHIPILRGRVHYLQHIRVDPTTSKMSGSQSQQERMHDAQSREMMIDPELLALDARAAEESANDTSKVDNTKLEALEILLPGISQYLARQEGEQAYKPSAVNDRMSQPGSLAQTSSQFGSEYPDTGCVEKRFEATDNVPLFADQVNPVAQRTLQYASNASGQEEQIQFEVEYGEAKDADRSEYLAWLSRQ